MWIISILHTRARMCVCILYERSQYTSWMYAYLCMHTSQYAYYQYSRVDVESTTLRAPINAILLYILRLVVYIQNDFVCILESTHTTYHHLLCIQYGYYTQYAYYTRVCSTMHTRVLRSQLVCMIYIYYLRLVVLIHTHGCTCSYAYSYQSSTLVVYKHTYIRART